MEAIRNYLETMFAQMPNTPDVRRAREELLAMMEDKYNELIAEGRSDNEAVGTVISEFGNLSELAESLGISYVFNESRNTQGRKPADMEEIESYIETGIASAVIISAGIFFCIICVCFPILLGSLPVIPTLMFFVSVGLGVLLIVYGSGMKKKFRHLFTGEYYLDYAATKYVTDQQHNFDNTSTLLRSLGIMLCVVCFVPSVILNNEVNFIGKLSLSDIGAALLFILVGFGVFLIVYSSKIRGVFKKLLKLNDETTISGDYSKTAQSETFNSYNTNNTNTANTNDRHAKKNGKKAEVFSNGMAEFVASVYWPTVVCLYLIWSFQTFSWAISWIIFPIASAARKPILRYLDGLDQSKNNYQGNSFNQTNSFTQQNTQQNNFNQTGDVIDAQYTDITPQSSENKEEG